MKIDESHKEIWRVIFTYRLLSCLQAIDLGEKGKRTEAEWRKEHTKVYDILFSVVMKQMRNEWSMASVIMVLNSVNERMLKEGWGGAVYHKADRID